LSRRGARLGRRAWLVPLLVALAALSLPALAEAAEPGSIAGTVTAQKTGAAVQGVIVCADSTEGGAQICGKTDAFGRYLLEGLPAGSYVMAYLTFETGQNLEPSFRTEDFVTVPAGGAVTGVDAALEPGAAIEGTVSLATGGAPLADVEVCLVGAFWPGVKPLLLLGCTVSAGDGGYRFIGLSVGTYKVVFSPEAGDLKAYAGEPPAISPDAYRTQWWSLQGESAKADVLDPFRGVTIGGVDGILSPLVAQAAPPPSVTPPATPTPTPPATVVAPPVAPRPLHCRHGFVKRRVGGKARCVKKPKRHPRRHRPKRHAHRG
jgi:hypothetical protein